MNTKVTHKRVAGFSDLAQKKIGDWREYSELNEFLTHFNSISPNEALQMATELKGLTKNLKDSLKIDILKIDALKARVNVFENEVLRLNDMALIPAVKAKEVNSQIDKILLVFGSYNNKVNTIYSKEQFNQEINPDDFFELRSIHGNANEFKKTE